MDFLVPIALLLGGMALIGLAFMISMSGGDKKN